MLTNAGECWLLKSYKNENLIVANDFKEIKENIFGAIISADLRDNFMELMKNADMVTDVVPSGETTQTPID